MQALSQLSYGPALLRAENHSDISTSWEVVCTKSCTEEGCHLPGQSQGRTYGVRRSSRGRAPGALQSTVVPYCALRRGFR
ncbi:hypothetical protein FDU21_02705 [Xanthomonas oryzae pv. oryzae]|nr:hypothetical protein FDU21_02705 [Xanthomonas oryzae pv. oryzae]